MSKPYISSAYLGAMSSLFSEPVSRKRFSRHDEHIPKSVLKDKKNKRKTANKSRKKNRK